MISKKKNKLYRRSYRPYYDKRHKCWKVDFTDRFSEFGTLLYVMGEYVHSCLYFPYNNSRTKDMEYTGHAHSFDRVLEALLEDPEGFGIEGFEEYYSSQERELLKAVQEKLRQKPMFKKRRLLARLSGKLLRR